MHFFPIVCASNSYIYDEIIKAFAISFHTKITYVKKTLIPFSATLSPMTALQVALI
jgi:hypothetical protein